MIRNLIIALFASTLAATAASADVNGPGPSDPNDFDTVINLPGDEALLGRRIGNAAGDATPTIQLNVADGGSVGSSFGASSGSEINISGGDVGEYFDAYFGSEVNISGGSVDHSFGANRGSEVNISGGSVNYHFRAHADSNVNISGGSIGRFFRADSRSKVSISGGSIGHDFKAEFGTVELSGSEFLLNGIPFSESRITIGDNDVFTGTLADGSSFIFSSIVGDQLNFAKLSEVPVPPLNTTPRVVNTDVSTIAPSGLRAGQTLLLQPDGVLGDAFAVVDATLNIEGGTVGRGTEVTRGVVNISGSASVDTFFYAYADSKVNIRGGSVGRFLYSYDGSEVNISGGSVGDFLRALSGGVVNISGGSVGDGFFIYAGSKVNMSGGSVGDGFFAHAGSRVNISGGSIGSFAARAGSEVNLIGTEFFLNGVPLDTLTQHEPSTIASRGGQILSGTLADGSAFSFELNDLRISTKDFFSTDSLLTVTLVPEPSSVVLLLLAGGGFFVRRRFNVDARC